MTRRNRKPDVLIPVPAELPPLEGPTGPEEEARRRRRRRVSRWTLLLAVGVVLLLLFVFALAGLGVYHGWQDRARSNAETAQEHYALGLQHLEAREYELAVAELELAARHAPNLDHLQAYLRRAKELAEAQVTPTSETRQEAALSLYRTAVDHYENGELEPAVAALEELRGLDPETQRKNVETMLVTAHYQLGLSALREDRLDDAGRHFRAVLKLGVDPAMEQQAQQQLNLLELYRAALSHWDQDWPATIQALKGLYALAPDYKDVQTRLHDAYVLHAQGYAGSGDWCRAADEFSAALEVFPLEETADRRDDAQIRCQTATPAPTAPSRPTGTPADQAGGQATAAPSETPQARRPPATLAKGRIAFPAYDVVHQLHSLQIVDLADGTPRLLVEKASQPSFDPAGSRLAFRNLDPSYLGLGILNLGNGQVSELTPHVEDSTPTWSADASQILFGSDKEGDRRWRIYVISPGAVRGEGQVWAHGMMPAWSSDGSEIAYHGCDLRGDNCGLWTMEPGGFNQLRLTSDASDTSPSWRPDGSEVAFISARAGNWELYAVDVATGTQRRLTSHPAADVAPVWSPDGKLLAFLSNRDGAWGLYILDLKSAQLQKVLVTGDAYPDAVGERLAWSR